MRWGKGGMNYTRTFQLYGKIVSGKRGRRLNRKRRWEAFRGGKGCNELYPYISALWRDCEWGTGKGDGERFVVREGVMNYTRTFQRYGKIVYSKRYNS